MTLVAGPMFGLKFKNKQGKIILLFGDYHKNLHLQHECPISSDYTTIDIFFKTLWQRKKDKKFGFFLEVHPNRRIECNVTSTAKYIDKLRQLFFDNFKLNKNKVVKSKKFPNVMFHHFDTRTYNKYPAFDKTDIGTLIPFVKEMVERLKYSEEIRGETINKIKKDANKTKHGKLIYTLVKYLKVSYKDALTICHDLEKTYAIKFKEFDIRKFTDVYIVRRNFVSMLQAYSYKLCYLVANLDCLLTDYYLLKRLLTKDYDTDIDIVYAGAWHSVHIALFLLRFTDFEIVTSTGNHKYLESIRHEYSIKKMALTMSDIIPNFLGYDPIFESANQCVDLTDFELL